METNQKIAEWAGWKDIWQGNTALIGTPPWSASEECVPDYAISDADAVSLLPFLAQRGYWWEMHLTDANNRVQFNVHKYDGSVGRCVGISAQPTISQAIAAAMGQLIESI